MGKKVKLGAPIFAFPQMQKVPIAASQTFSRRSGHYVKLDASKHADIADSGDSEIAGWMHMGKDFTSSSTAGADKGSIDAFPFSVYEVPARDTFTAANLASYIGETCDLEVASNIQYVDNGESNEDNVVVVGGDVDEQTLYVHLNPNKMYQTGIGD